MKYESFNVVRAQTLTEAGHCFRGAYFDRCAMIEVWMDMVLTAAGGGQRRSKQLLGQRLNGVRLLAEADAAADSNKLFRNPDRVLKLLNEFQPYSDLRSHIGHSVQTIRFSSDGEPVFFYASMGSSPATALAFTAAGQADLLRRVRSLASRFTDQKLR